MALRDADGDAVDQQAGAVVLAETLHKVDALIAGQTAIVKAINSMHRTLGKMAKRGL